METLEHIIHHEGAFADKGHARTWSNLLVNAFFFFGIGLGALFFIALQYATESGWGVVYKRILEGIIGWLPVGAIILTLIFFAGSMQWNHIWHWMDPEVMNPDSSHFDAIIANKQPFLSQWFFWLMNAVYFAVFLLFARGFRKRSLQEDIEGGTKIHMKNFAKGALFLVLFGYLSSVMSWHWIMSIDTHWFSTLFGWFVFSGIWVSATIFILLLVFWLKSQGYLEFINESHIHDMGKWMFAISFLWTYLFFSQFMLIWYANIPEEVTYYLDRFGNYKWILWTTVAVNFVIPIVLLMSREAKRSRPTIMIIGAILFVFHWVDVFIMIMPGSVFDHWAIGVLEVGMFVFFLGLFIFTVLRTLSKAPLLVKNHPYLDENLHHHT
ncbi:MAG: quinol:cytochrome C oxidoreductase [Flavobacteriales bacterium]|nr:quinol:cytochrome C oxidoreductase [Flavobacteriales bacterium]